MNSRSRESGARQSSRRHSAFSFCAFLEEEGVKAELEEERLRASLALRPEELRQEPVKKEANKRALKALGFDDVTLAQKPGRRSSGLSRTGSKGSSSRGGQDASSKGVSSEESSSDSEDIDIDSSAGSAMAPSPFARTQSSSTSVPESSLQQGCSRPSIAQFFRGSSDRLSLAMGQDDADEGAEPRRARSVHRTRSFHSSPQMPLSSIATNPASPGHDDADEGAALRRARSVRRTRSLHSSPQVTFTSTGTHSTSLSASSVLLNLSRRFSSNELDKTQRFSNVSRRQSSSNGNVGNSALAPGVQSTQHASQPCDTALRSPPPSLLAGCLSSSADPNALHTKQASSGEGGQGPVPPMPPSPFSKAGLGPRPSLRWSSSIAASSTAAAGACGQPFVKEKALSPAAQYTRRITGGATLGGAGRPSAADARPASSQYIRRSTGGATVGGDGQSARAEARPTSVRLSRRVSFAEGAARDAIAAADASSDPAAESQPAAERPQLTRSYSMGKAQSSVPGAESLLAAVPPQLARSLSMGTSHSGSSVSPALQRTSSGGASTSRALQPTRVAWGAGGTPAAVAETGAGGGGV